MKWAEWAVSPPRPTDCIECRQLAELNDDQPDCSACSMPRECSRMNAEAWDIWAMLDKFGRDYDTMAGNPLPLRLEAVTRECARYSDPDGLRWRVLEIEKRVLSARQEQKK